MTGTEMEFPQPYNAVTEFIDSHLAAGRADKTAVIDVHGEHSYGELVDQVNRVAAMLRSMGLRREARIAMIMDDTLAFPALFWGAIKAGVVPIPLNILLTGADYQGILADCRAQAVFISRPLYENVSPALKNQPFLSRVIIDGASVGGHPSLQDLLPVMESDVHTAETHADEVAFWLYSSGSTGAPKGVMHLHRHLRATAELFGRQVLGIEEDDRIFSAAKLFFAYGLGNGMTFPFAVGATAVYLTGRPTPDTVMETLRTHQPTIYCGVPTLYAAILAEDGYGRETASKVLRRCVSAGEALPKEIGERWEQRFGAEILDGVGSTEMLHIFLSNRPGQVSYGSSGLPVPGYQARLVDEEGAAVSQGEVGELLINGPSAAAGYWNRRDKSLGTFEGRWTRTGDKYYQDERGLYHYCGRTDDMMKVSGQWVSPFEVESALIAHESVLEAAVIPDADEAGNIKTKAYVVMKPGKPADVNMLQDFVKDRLARWKYPRSIEFIDELPKTATGKIQRFKLRQPNEAR